MAEDLSINKNKIFTQRYGNSNNDICRLCLKNEAHMEPLFYSNLFPNILLTKKIYDCTSIQIIYERNLPMFVCKLCANKLDEYVRFRDRCIANDEFLRNALAAFDANGGSCSSGIKMEPEDTSPPPPLPPTAPTTAKFAHCLAVTPMELNCALVAAAAVAAGHQSSKREPPDVEESHERYGSGAVSPDRSSCGRMAMVDELPSLKQTHDDRYRSGEEEDDLPADDAYGEPNPGAKQYVCEVCSKSFRIRHHLLVHRHTHVDNHAAPTNGLLHGGSDFNGGVTGSGKQSYNCPKCAKVFVNKGNLLNHLETHTNEKSYACDICTKTFKYNVQLRLHMRIHTGERPHKCEICNRGFSQLSNLRSHRKTHSKVKPYKCHLCLKSFTMLDNLTAHSAKCLKDKFRCTLCSKSFAKEGNLLSHLQSHTDGIVEKMFKCEMCPKSFKNKEDWKRHVRVHTGEKPYTCDICSKGFAQKANLLSHRKTHLKPNVVYKCERCARTFRSQKVLQLHVPKCSGIGVSDGTSVPSAPATPVSESVPDSPSPGTAVTQSNTASSTVASANDTPTLSEALSDLLRYEIALRAPLELQQMLLGHIDRKKPQNGTGGKATGRRYRCDVCFKGYSQYPSLIKHRKLHFKVPPLVKVLAGKGKHDADYEDHEEPRDAGCDEHATDGRHLDGTTPPPEPHDPIERPYSCDICGGRFEAASDHPPDRCRQELQLRVLLEPVPLERGPEAAPTLPHRRAALPLPALPESVYPAVEPSGPREDPRALVSVPQPVPMLDAGSRALLQPVTTVEPACVT
ncbi:zinc finger protein 227-like [Anopheles maculipalpis]|uniref:zinc finger protein 227-like n=1 Tax=Anopheles maculipalpis TaxID=1496333 RepID=UPI0021593D81|nr:zinc finger protein 227-like [Anopheles maculipalpis]